MNTATQNHERTLVKIVRTLPPKRAEQLVDFARFLEAQILAENLTQEEETEVVADNARWDALFATDKGQSLLEKLAEEALTEHQAGKTKPMSVNVQGRIVPG